MKTWILFALKMKCPMYRIIIKYDLKNICFNIILKNLCNTFATTKRNYKISNTFCLTLKCLFIRIPWAFNAFERWWNTRVPIRECSYTNVDRLPSLCRDCRNINKNLSGLSCSMCLLEYLIHVIFALIFCQI